MELEIFSEHDPLGQRGRNLIVQLEAHNLTLEPSFDQEYRHFGYFVRDREDGKVLGGIVGWTWMGSLHIHRFFVNAVIRGQGYGSKLIETIECHARSQGCSLITVETLSFQNALSFYLKHGFKLAFEDHGYSHGIRIYFLRKHPKHRIDGVNPPIP